MEEPVIRVVSFGTTLQVLNRTSLYHLSLEWRLVEQFWVPKGDFHMGFNRFLINVNLTCGSGLFKHIYFVLNQTDVVCTH
jgi:hypothetical protein